MQKTPYVFPVVGGRKIEHMLANIEALSVALTPAHIKQIEDATPFDLGFPHTICGDGTALPFLLTRTTNFDKVPVQQALRPTVAGETKLPSFN